MCIRDRISCGLYVYHNFVYNYYHSPALHPTARLFNKLSRTFPDSGIMHLVQFGILFVFTTLVASLSWFLIEKPNYNLKDKYSS